MMPRFPLVLAAALIGAAVPLVAPAQQTPAFEPRAETPEELPEGPGRDETFYSCTACHSTALIRRQQLTREGWDAVITDMTRNRGMPEPSPDDRRLILDYLATAFPVQSRPQGGWRNPFAQ